jgi:hypothetical protein
MFYTSGDFHERRQRQPFSTSCAGRGFIGVHSATDTFYTWPDYLDQVGGYFNGHPWHQAVTIRSVDPGDPVVAFLGNFRNSRINLPNQRLRLSRIASAPSPRPKLGGPWQTRCASTILRLASRLETVLRPGTRILYGARPEASVWQDPATACLANAILWSMGKSP